MYKITDWTGRDCFHGQTFNTMHDADDHLVEHLHRVHPNATEEEFDAIRGEFYVEPVREKVS